MPIARQMSRVWLAILLAIATGAIYFAPTFAYWRQHSSQFFPVDAYDEDYYAALASTLAMGRALGAHPLLADQNRAHGIGSESLAFLPRVVTAEMIKGIGLGRAFGVISLIAPALIFILVYLSLYEITLDSWWALAGAGGVLLLPFYLPGARASILSIAHILSSRFPPGLGMPDGLSYARRYNPALSAILFYFFLLLHWKVSQSKQKALRVSVLCGIVGGLLFYSYFFFAAGAFAISFFWVLLTAWKQRERFHSALVTLLIQTLLAIPFLIVTFNNRVIYQSAFGRGTHAPYFPTTDVVAILLPAAALILLRGLTAAHLWLGAAALGPVAAMNAQVVTGVSVEPWHFDTFLVIPISVFLFCAACAILLRPFLRISSAAAILVIFVAFLVGAMTQARIIRGESIIPIPDHSTFDETLVPSIRSITGPNDVLLMGDDVTTAPWLVATTARPVFASFYVESFPSNSPDEYRERADCYYWLGGDSPASFYAGPASDPRSYVYADVGFHYWFRQDLLTPEVKQERTGQFESCMKDAETCCRPEFRADWSIESANHPFDRQRLSQIYTVVFAEKIGDYVISKLSRKR